MFKAHAIMHVYHGLNINLDGLGQSLELPLMWLSDSVRTGYIALTSGVCTVIVYSKLAILTIRNEL